MQVFLADTNFLAVILLTLDVAAKLIAMAAKQTLDVAAKLIAMAAKQTNLLNL